MGLIAHPQDRSLQNEVLAIETASQWARTPASRLTCPFPTVFAILAFETIRYQADHDAERC